MEIDKSLLMSGVAIIISIASFIFSIVSRNRDEKRLLKTEAKSIRKDIVKLKNIKIKCNEVIRQLKADPDLYYDCNPDEVSQQYERVSTIIAEIQTYMCELQGIICKHRPLNLFINELNKIIEKQNDHALQAYENSNQLAVPDNDIKRTIEIIDNSIKFLNDLESKKERHS